MSTPEIEALIKEIRSRADAPPSVLHPWDYARARVQGRVEGERGYNAAAHRVVATALGITEDAVRSWGPQMKNAPPHWAGILYRLDILEQIATKTVGLPESTRAVLQRIIPH